MKGTQEAIRVEAAQAAIVAGLAALASSTEGRAMLDWRLSLKSIGMGPEIDEYVSLGDPLGLQRAYEAANAASASANDDVETEEAARAVG